MSNLQIQSRLFRITWLSALLLALILIPFFLFETSLTRWSELWLASNHSRAWIALFGVALLIADVFLPIPSSLVSIALCLKLGPLFGGLCVALGMVGSYALGYWVARRVPLAWIVKQVGETDFQRIQASLANSGAAWIAMTRPLPVLAEATALIAGALRLPFKKTLGAAIASSCVVAACYAAATALGSQVENPWIPMVGCLVVASVFWLASRRLGKNL